MSNNLINNPVAGGTTLWFKQHSSEIMLGLGIASGLASTVTACVATAKVNRELDPFTEELDILDAEEKELEEHPNGLTSEQIRARKEELKEKRRKVRLKAALMIAKHYAPAVAFGVSSACFSIGSHMKQVEKTATIAAAYAGLQTTFNKYRDRVKAQLGDDMEAEFRYGTTEKEVPWDENDEGHDPSETHTVSSINAPEKSDYSVLFDEANPNWTKYPSLNKQFLTIQEQNARDILLSRGWISYNEVLVMLGFDLPISPANMKAGWVKGDTLNIGLYSPGERAEAFRNGQETSIWLDFEGVRPNIEICC